MEFRRTGRQLAIVGFNLVIAAALAWWNIREGLRDSRTGIVLLGIGFAGWAIFLLLHLVRQRTYGRIESDAVVLRTVVREPRVPFEQMRWAHIQGGRHASVIAYRAPGEEKDRLARFSRRFLGPEATRVLQEAIFAARPDLPDRAPDVALR